MKTEIISGVAAKTITPTNLPHTLYNDTSETLMDAVKRGFGEVNVSGGFSRVDEAILKELGDNIYMFSAAKEFQQILMLSEYFKKYEDHLISFQEFKEFAESQFDIDYVSRLESEYFTAVNSSASVAHWQQTVSRKDILPLIQIVVIEDGVTCDICRQFDGATFPIDSEYSDTMIPPFHYNNCRCTWRQLATSEATPWADDKLNEALTNADINGRIGLFRHNPGKTKEVFKSTGDDKHPYFVVPNQYRELARNNFNLHIPHNHG